MLTDLNLDNENFNDMVEDAKNLIASEYPEWTDFNYHDPGITLTEMFAFFKEVSQYRMNYIGEAHQIKYLKLLGVKRNPMQPAQARVKLNCKKTQQLPAMTRFYASGVCFESTTSKYVVEEDIKGCVYAAEQKEIFMDRGRMKFTRSWKIPVFGKLPKSGACFYLMFGESLPVRKNLSVFADVYKGYDIRRNPIGSDGFEPMAQIIMEYYTDGGWRRCEVFEDMTWAFLQSGWLEFTLDYPMTPVTVAGQNGYFIRFVLQWADYDIPPVIESVGMNYLDVRQTQHYAVCQDIVCEQKGNEAFCRLEANEVTTQNIAVLTNDSEYRIPPVMYRIYENYRLERKGNSLELTVYPDSEGRLPEKVRILSWESFFDAGQVIGEGDGLPFQEYELEGISPVAEGFILMIEEPGGQGVLCQWQQVEDFAGSGPADRHYILDTRQNKIIFGDCIRGMAPEGRILIAQCVVSEGAKGNVKAEKMNIMEDGYESIAVINEENAAGGQDEETLEKCFFEARQALHENIGLVTDKDYVLAVCRTPGLMIENCCVLHIEEDKHKSTGSEVWSIVVKPFSFEKNPRLSEPYVKNIMAALDKRRMIGTKIRLVSPEYVKINVFAECRGRSNYVHDREVIIGALNRYFKPFSTNFGGMIYYSEVYELLDRLDAVETMETLSIDVIGSSVGRNYGGDIILPPNGLISSGDIQYNININ